MSTIAGIRCKHRPPSPFIGFRAGAEPMGRPTEEPSFMRAWRALPKVWVAGLLVALIAWRQAAILTYVFCALAIGLGIVLIVGGGRPMRSHLPTPPPASAWSLLGLAFIGSGTCLSVLVWKHISSGAVLVATAIAVGTVLIPGLRIRLYRGVRFF